MAVKTFTSGEVLTAADTNTYLNNGGLVYVKSQTIGTAVAAQAVTSAFSADYTSYKIVVSGGSSTSGSAYMTLQLGSATSNYRYSYVYATLSTLIAAQGTVTGSNFGYVGAVGGVLSADITINNPFTSTITTCQAYAGRTGNDAGHFLGFQVDTTSFTGFTIGVSAGTMTGGTITVYGYRKA